MHIEKLSLTALTVSVLLIIGAVAVATSFVSETEYRRAAVEAQTRTVTRILRVATDAAISQLKTNSAPLAAAAGKALARQPELNSYLAEAPPGTTNPTLAALMAAPLATELADLKPLSVGLYNSKGQPLMSSGQAETLDAGLLETRDPKQQTAAFWLSDTGARYTVLQPIGAPTNRGYLAISFDPAYALQSVASLTHLPLRRTKATVLKFTHRAPLGAS